MSAPQKSHNNCSGKHAGMLILAKLLTGSTSGYEATHHACQQKILGVLEAMTGSDLTAYPIGIDGCGAPVYRAPLGNWARAFALFASGGVLPRELLYTSFAAASALESCNFSLPRGLPRMCKMCYNTEHCT